MNNTNISIEEIISSGNTLIMTLLGQLRELNNLQEKNIYKSILSSSIILSFSILEAYLNYITELIITEHNRKIASPKIINRLHDLEIDMLLEKKSIFDVKKIEVTKTDNSYIKILDKAIVVPQLLAKVYNEKLTIDKGQKKWQYIQLLKEKRDEISHPKFDSKKIEKITNLAKKNDKLKPSYTINPDDLSNGLIGLRWYFRIIGELLIKIFNGKFSSFHFQIIDMLFTRLIIDIDKTYSLNKKNSNEIIDDKYKFAESRDEKLNKIIKTMTSYSN